MRAARNHKLLTMMLAVAATPLLAASASSAAEPVGCTAAEQSIAYGVGRWPSSCWRPYSSSSPFNRTIGRRPPRVSNSHAIVRHLVQGGKVRGGCSARVEREPEHPHQGTTAACSVAHTARTRSPRDQGAVSVGAWSLWRSAMMRRPCSLSTM